MKECDDWVEHYDFARAAPLLGLADKIGLNGPVLVGWDLSPENGRMPTHQLVLDLSDFSDSDMERAFGIWIRQFTQDPRNWTHRFDMVRIRESFRNLLQKYGAQIMVVVDKAA